MRQITLPVPSGAGRIDPTLFLKTMADHRLDAIVHKSVEHQPTLICDGLNPPCVDHKGAPRLNTFLVFVPTVVVPAGFTSDGLPAGISFLGRPYDDGNMIKLAMPTSGRRGIVVRRQASHPQLDSGHAKISCAQSQTANFLVACFATC